MGVCFFLFSHTKQFYTILFASVSWLHFTRMHIQAKGRSSSFYTTANTKFRTRVQQSQISFTGRPKKTGPWAKIKRSTGLTFVFFCKNLQIFQWNCVWFFKKVKTWFQNRRAKFRRTSVIGSSAKCDVICKNNLMHSHANCSYMREHPMDKPSEADQSQHDQFDDMKSKSNCTNF